MKLLPIFIPLSWARTLVTTCMHTFNLFIKWIIKSCTVHYFSDIVALFVQTVKLRESVLACIKRSCLYHFYFLKSSSIRGASFIYLLVQVKILIHATVENQSCTPGAVYSLSC